MIRLAHISDTHVCDQGRVEDLQEVLHAFLDDAREADVELIVHAGDFFDKRSTPRERLVLAEFLREASEIAPVFGVKGNHDAPRDLELFNHLETDSKVIVVDRPTRPGEAHFLVGRFALLALPWFDKAHLVAGLDATVDGETTRLMTIEAAQDLLVGLHAEAARVRGEGRIPVLVSHAMVQGSVMSTGQVIQGTTVELSPYALQEIGAEYVALGHVHKTQAWFDGRVAYSGSPLRHNFGEPEEKGWRLVTFDDEGRFVSNEFRPLPARQIVLLEVDWTNGNLDRAGAAGNPIDMGDISNIAGALVRFRCHVRAQDLHLVDQEALKGILAQEGAADVKIEAVVEHQTRVRSEAITTARSTLEKIQAYLSAKGEPIDEPTMGRITEKLSEIEQDAAP